MIFGDSRLNLTDEVGAYVRGLGVDAATHTGKESNGGRPKGESG